MHRTVVMETTIMGLYSVDSLRGWGVYSAKGGGAMHRTVVMETTIMGLYSVDSLRGWGVYSAKGWGLCIEQ